MFWFLFPALILTFLLVRILAGPWWWGRYHRWGAYGPCGYGPYVGPHEVLRQQLARGDITVEEYERRMAALP